MKQAAIDEKDDVRQLQQVNFYTSQSKIFEENSKLTELLKLYCGQIEASLKNENPDFENHFFVKTISIPKSKSVEVTISMSPRELKTDDFTLNEKAVSQSYTFLIQRYDFIRPKVAAGIFYSSATLNGYNTTANGENELVVTENDIDKNTAVTGVFLNLNFDIGSQFLEPLIQIGVDPTKDKPYLLAGAGFAIPVSKFSISGGPIWTWEAQLDKLKVDDVVASESVLKDDIKYEFQAKPRGFYLGLNYTF